MDTIPIGVLVGALVILLLLSGFFSSAEISAMSLNRYRLKTLADSGHRGARILMALLERPDRLLGIILLGNNLVNLSAAAVTTMLAIRVYGESSIFPATLVLTIVMLIFAEVGPKTIAALRPESIGLPAAYVLKPLLTVLYPVVALINFVANRGLRLFGVSLEKGSQHLGLEELRSVVMETGGLIPESHQSMLLGILDLEKTTVEDVMIPRGQIAGIDLEEDWDDILEQITNSRYTRLPVYEGSLDKVVGILHLRKALNLVGNDKLDMESLRNIMAEPYFIPKGTSLNTQLINFKKKQRRRGLVVDEYGDILGLVTLEEILEEIIGEFTGDARRGSDDVFPQEDGSFLVKGSASLRTINKRMGWDLPEKESKTLNGLITEYLEDLPEAGTSLRIGDYAMDVVRTRGTAVEVAKVMLTSEEQIEKAAQDQSAD